MSQNIDIAVIGGGFAGLSTAYHLSKNSSLSIVVLEQEKKLGGHASGRNAGMIRQALSDPYLARLAKEGREALQSADKNGWNGIRFRAQGSLLLGKGRAAGELKKIHAILRKEKIPSRWLSAEEATKRVKILREADFKQALFCPSDAMVDINGLLNGFIKTLRRRGVRVLCGQRIQAIFKDQKGFKVQTSKNIFYARKIVNAAGAWAGLVGERAGATRIPFKAYRRHLFFADPMPGFKADWPFVWDISHNVYFRPQGNQFMLSPCDKALFKLDRENKIYGADPRIREVLAKKLNSFSPKFPKLKIRSQVAGLRTMVPDGRFVIGEDPKLKNFYWAAGLGGHGVTTAFSAGRLAGDIILNRKVDLQLKKVFSPKRFLNAA